MFLLSKIEKSPNYAHLSQNLLFSVLLLSRGGCRERHKSFVGKGANELRESFVADILTGHLG